MIGAGVEQIPEPAGGIVGYARDAEEAALGVQDLSEGSGVERSGKQQRHQPCGEAQRPFAEAQHQSMEKPKMRMTRGRPGADPHAPARQ